MKFGSVAVLAATITVAAACDKAPAPLPRVPVPGDVVAVITLPAFETTMPALYLFADNVEAAAGTKLRGVTEAGIDAELGRDAIDWKKPLHVVVVAPTPGNDEPDYVLVAGARDAAALTKRKTPERDVRVDRSWVAVGPTSAVERTWRWSLGTLAPDAAPARPRVTVFPAAVRSHYGDELRAALDPGDSKPRAFVRDAIVGLLDQTESAEVLVDLTTDQLSLDLALVPRARTPLATMLAAQQPATFAMLERLPLDSPMTVMAAQLSLGELAAPVRQVLSTVLTDALGDFGPRSAALLELLWTNSTGEYAGVGLAAGTVINAVGVTDEARLRTEVDAMARAVTKTDLPAATFSLEHPSHDGVSFSLGTVTSKTQDVRLGFTWAIWDGMFALAGLDGDGAIMRAAITRSRAKAAPPPAIARALADARARQDSLFWTLDFSGGVHPLAAFGFGVRDGAARVRMQLPAPQLKFMMQMSMSGG